VKFFFDNCISSNLAEAMAYLNRQHHEIEHLTKKFDADALDVDWIPVVAKDTNVILVSADPAITTAKKEKEIWRQSGLTPAGNMSIVSRPARPWRAAAAAR
jgi:glutamyl-tRNA reductase